MEVKSANSELEGKVNAALESLRPFLMEDGGDIELVEITSQLEVYVRFLGACQTCSMSNMTFKAGVEQEILRFAPDVVAVHVVDSPS